MKLASKIFLASSLVIVVLFIVGGLSLRAVGRLVSVNRDITTRTMPAIHDASSIHAAMPGLARLEARMLILRDPRYVTRWEEQAAQARDDLARLGPLLTTPRQEALLRQAKDAFDEYQRLVGEEQALLARGQREQALRLSDTETRALIERVESLLDQLIEQIRSAALGAQAEAARLEARTWGGVLIAFGAAVVLALVGTAAIAFRLTWSLRALSAATSAVATGSFPEPVRVEGEDEVAALARSFNAMAEQLRELDALKETFLATVSHELRSPLTSMREAAHLLRDEVPGGLNPKQARLVKIIEAGSERLLRLVNQILDLSRLRAGTLPIERKPFELDRLVARAVEELRPQAQEAGLALEVERTGQRFDYLGDEDRLVQVVVNLVANAIRFTPRGGRVTARVLDVGPEIEVHVEDTGIGIPASALPHIFGWYEQAHHRRGGTGLGLPIVRGLVEAHGGRVTVESQEGKGSRFTVLLPRGRAEE
ncbi:MAG TPA: ATP-binding protein [Methylomirabilota bacterium]|jgi:signal transduction histidine kinase|nr:ATP-binding protein [Methylomirabilota bacterium]